jgi:hypothetical protein
MRRIAVPLAFALLSVGFAPAPFPKPERRAVPLSMAGVWEGEWAGSPVRLTFRPDGSARFEYTKMQGTWDGTWRFDEQARRVTLTLMIGGPQPYVLAFSVLTRNVAEGKILDTPTSTRPLKLARTGRQ